MKLLFITICFCVGFILFYKFFIIFNKIKKMTKVNAHCTDFIIRTFYNKKEYVAYYNFKYKKDKDIASDKTRLPFIKYFIKNNMDYEMYINKDNLKEYVSPYEVKIYKYYLIIAIILIVIPLIIFK